MNSVAALNKRGRAYMCRRCHETGSATVDRKGRLKSHIPLDQVPFSCSLCLFKAMDRKSLIGHLTKYARHVKLATEIWVVDNSQYLSVSARPVTIGDADMIMLSPELSAKYFEGRSREDPLDDLDDVWDPTEVCRGTPLASMTGRERIQRPSIKQFYALSYATSYSGLPTRMPTYPASMTASTTTVMPCGEEVIQLGGSSLPLATCPPIGQTMAETRTTMSSMTTLPPPPVMPLVMPSPLRLAPPATTSMSSLGLYRSKAMATPVLDEPDSFLRDLLGMDDTADPLRREMNGVPVVEKRALTSTPSSTDSHSKKRRIDTDIETENDHMKETKATETEKENSREDVIVKAIERATSKIVEALDRNTRAIRANETSIGKVVDELAHMSSVLAMKNTQDTRPEPKEVLKENRLKSVVTKKK